MINGLNGYMRRRVVIVDEAEFSNLLKLILDASKRYNVVSIFSSMEEAIPELKKLKPDILITDLELNGMTGLEGLRQIQNIYPSVEVVVCTNIFSADSLIESFSNGALGYILKDECYNQVVQYLDQLVKGGAPLSPTASRQLIESFRKNPTSPLSFRETEIVRLLAKGNTYTQIASSLQISKETSKTHMRNIYKKLGVNSKALALQRVMEDHLI
jgi:DNA-binding NarL/FixJ family response regulator